MNEVTFNYESHIVGGVEFNPQGIQGGGGAYAPRLRLPCTFKFKVWGVTNLVFLTLTGAFAVAGERLGELVPYTFNRVVRSQYGEQREMPMLEAILDLKIIERIEQLRRKDVEIYLELKLGYLAYGPPITFPQKPEDPPRISNDGTIQIHYDLVVPQSIWITNVLPRLGYGTIRPIELPAIADMTCDALKKSFTALDQGHHHLKLGNYDEAVGKCRVALEPFWEYVEETKDGKTRDVPHLRRSWETVIGKATYEWLQKTLIGIKRESNPTHHSPQPHFDRLGAEMLIVITTVVVRYAARELDAGGAFNP